MNNGNMPAVPLVNTLGAPHRAAALGLDADSAAGLTKLELYAGMAMHGLLANSYAGPDTQPLSTASPAEIAQLAVAQAKALLDELEREA